jgi:hypothetical protein
VKPPTTSGPPVWDASRSTLSVETLERILASPAFRNSKQCQKFLRSVVDPSRAGADDMLKERTIGSEVFGREPDYETGDDPVVRVRATEVRKRLAQYYQESAVPADVRLEMPQGSYRVEFHFPEAPPQTLIGRPSLAAWRGPAALALSLLALGVIWLFFPRGRAQSALDRFWAPVLSGQKPVLLYCGQPVTYFLSGDVHKRYRDSLPAETRERGSYVVRLQPDEVVHGRDIIAVTDQFVGIGNAHTAAALSALFAAKGRAVEIRYANDLSFADLRGASSVLIGAFSNPWTLEMTGQLRFVFEQEDGKRRVRDRTDGRTWQPAHIEPDGKTAEDYAVVSRVFDSATGQILIAAAGITQYGTRSAGEFLTDSNRFAGALTRAPADWPRRNMQVLLRTAVYKGTPAAPQVVAAHYW